MSTARDLALNPSTGDLLIVGQDLAPLLTDDDAITSAITAATKFVAGEWFANLGQGIPWLQIFANKNVNLAAIQSTLFQAYSAIPGVTQVQSISVAPNYKQRTASVSWVVLVDATKLNGTVTVP